MTETSPQYVLTPQPPTLPTPDELVARVIWPDMPAEIYHAIPAMSAGGLKRMRASPAHFFGMQLDPDRPPPGDPTASMKNGTLTHCCLFEPDQVAARYVVLPDNAPRKPTAIQRAAKKPSPETLEAIVWWDDFERAHQGAEIVERAQLAAAWRQANNMRALPDVGALLQSGQGEASIFWRDPVTGELCKCRPDWLSPAGAEGLIVVDGKTTADASPEGFARACWNMDYPLQAAWYSDGIAQALQKTVHGFVFAVAENSWPHQAAAYMLDDDVMAWARRENRRLLDLYAECKRTGIWPGYPQEIQPITMPAWAQKEIYQ